MKEGPETVDMYIDMKSDPTLKSFFSSDSSTSDSSSLKDKGITPRYSIQKF